MGQGGTDRAVARAQHLEWVWLLADRARARGALEPLELERLTLGLILLRRLEFAFLERRRFLLHATCEPGSPYHLADEAARRFVVDAHDEYAAVSVAWVREDARWSEIVEHVRDGDLGARLDAAMDALEAENPELRGALPRGYAEADRSGRIAGSLVTAVDEIGGDAERDAGDALVEAFDLLVEWMADGAGRRRAEYFTPRSVVELAVRLLDPRAGVLYDPCCGSGAALATAVRHARAAGADPRIFAQEASQEAWGGARMSMSIRQANAELGNRAANTLTDDVHRGLRADRIVAVPPFNMRLAAGDDLEWDLRWAFGTPPRSNANFAWLQHVVHHLAPDGRAAVVLANGSLFSASAGERQIRSGLVTAGLVECVVALPAGLFAMTGIPTSLWLLAAATTPPPNAGRVLFVDARTLGEATSRSRNVLPDGVVERIVGTCRAWRLETAARYIDQPGFCRSVSLAEVADNDFALAPGRYVGATPPGPSGDLDAALAGLTAQWSQAREEGARLDDEIRDVLERLRRG